MSGDNLHDAFEIRPVTIEHIDQFNELLRYVFQVTNQDLEESGYEDGEIEKAKLPVLERSDVIGWFHQDRLISQVAVYPSKINIYGEIYNMGGLTGVGTYPEYAGQGLVTKLIEAALLNMREKNQLISYLFPYSIPYYRNKGWEIISDYLRFTLENSQIPYFENVDQQISRENVEHEDVKKVYKEFALKNHGAMLRNSAEWEEYWRWENEDERIAAISYDKENNPTGFLFYWIENDVFNIKEMLYLNQSSRKALWNFVHAHLSMIDTVKGNIFRNDPLAFWLEDGQIKEKISPYYMGRIVDVKRFLEKYPFRYTSKPFHFNVSDPLAPWNNGVFSVEFDKNNKAIISNKSIGEGITLDIQTLTSMMIGYKRPSYFYEIERIEASKEAIKFLGMIIPDKQPYFSDYF